MKKTSRWFVEVEPNTAAAVRLFCFPYAGGSSAAYYNWANILPSKIEVLAIELPGHGTRFDETPMVDLLPILSSLTADISNYVDKPFVFFGHSIGTIISFELCRNLIKENLPLPYLFIASGGRAPHLPPREKQIHALPDKEFILELKKYNEIPKTVPQNYNLITPFLPMLRADFAISENFHFIEGEPLPIPITALGGTNDSLVTEEDIIAWKLHTQKNFNYKLFPGEHFFIKTSQTQVLETVAKTILEEDFHIRRKYLQ